MTALRDEFPKTYQREIKNARKEVVKVVDTLLWHQVADRLDDADEVARWSFAVIGVGDDWAHGRLTITDGGGFDRHYENFGYAENADAEWKKEALKDAVSDAFKRCAALAGVGRYLYDKERPQHAAPARQERPVAAAPAPARARPHIVDTDLAAPDEDDVNPFDDPEPPKQAGDRCPWHPDRTPKEGKYGLFCSGQGGKGPLNDKGYCNYKFAA